jgi:hypothetical protein
VTALGKGGGGGGRKGRPPGPADTGTGAGGFVPADYISIKFISDHLIMVRALDTLLVMSLI